MDQLQNVIPAEYWVYVAVPVAVCSALAVVLPAPKDDANIVWRVSYQLIQWIALNLGRAKNAQDSQVVKDAVNQ